MTSILLIRPSALGDVCRTVPVLSSLRRAHPDARIDWVVRDIFTDAVRFHPALTTCIPFPRNDISAALRRGNPAPLRRWLKGLQDNRYDIALDCQGLFRSGYFAWASGARRRIGYSNARELGWIWLNEKHHVPGNLHAVDRMLELTRLAGIEPLRDMRLYTSTKDRESIATDPALAGKRFAVIAPTSAWTGKQWPADRFAQVIRWMLESDPRIDAAVLVGTDRERASIAPLLELAKSDPRIIDRVGATTVGQLMALVESSAFVLGNDSAAIHMAVGFTRPAVAVFGATRIEENGPYTGHNPPTPVIVIQPPHRGERINHRRSAAAAVALMERITVEEVQTAITALPSTPPLRHSVTPSLFPTRSSSQSPS